MGDKVPPTTTDAGISVQSDEHSLTIGPDGPSTRIRMAGSIASVSPALTG